MKINIEPVIDLVRKSFAFLVSDCGYGKSEKLHDGNKTLIYINYVITYVNVETQKQLEMAIDVDGEGFGIVIRKLVNDNPSPYKNKLDNLLGTQLLFLKDNYDNYWNDVNNYSHNSINRERVIENYCLLLKQFQDELSSEKWFNVEKLKRHHIDYYKRKQNFDVSGIYEGKETLYEIIKSKLDFLIDQGYSLIFDSEELPIYEFRYPIVIYSKNDNNVTIKGPTYDDQSYKVIVNDKRHLLVFDLNYKSQEDFVDHIAYIIKETL